MILELILAREASYKQSVLHSFQGHYGEFSFLAVFQGNVLSGTALRGGRLTCHGYRRREARPALLWPLA